MKPFPPYHLLKKKKGQKIRKIQTVHVVESKRDVCELSCAVGRVEGGEGCAVVDELRAHPLDVGEGEAAHGH